MQIVGEGAAQRHRTGGRRHGVGEADWMQHSGELAKRRAGLGNEQARLRVDFQNTAPRPGEDGVPAVVKGGVAVAAAAAVDDQLPGR